MQLKRGAQKTPLASGWFNPGALTGVEAKWRCVMSVLYSRSIVSSALLVGLLPSTARFAADKPKTINIDWATYNPVSMVLKEKGLLEKEFAKDGIGIRWVQTLGSNKALE